MKLNLGSGDQKMEGYVAVDISEKCNPDIVYDIRKTPYPKEWNNCDEVRCDNILEHLTPDELIEVTNEIYEILKPGGKLWYRVPLLKMEWENMIGVFTDPTHKSFFTIQTPSYWDKNSPRGKVYGRDYGINLWSKVEAREWDKNTKFLICEMIK